MPTVTAGASFSLTVRAVDQFGNTATDYTGTVHFTSSDGSATLPANYTFTAGDGGIHTFTGVILRTAGTQTITVNDTVKGSLLATTSVTVSPAATNHFSLSAPATVTAGTPFSVTVTALDAFNNLASGYTGTVQFSSSDNQSMLPANYTFTVGDGGAHTFANGVTLIRAGSQTVTATDTVNISINGSAAVSVVAAPAVSFAIAAPAGVSSGTPFDVTITALDSYGNTDVNYQGTVTFSTSDSDPGVVLPADYTFTATDAGMHTFAGGVTLITPGDQTISATDSVSGATGSATVMVSGGAAAPPGGGAYGPWTPAIKPDITPTGSVRSSWQIAMLDRVFARVRGEEATFALFRYRQNGLADLFAASEEVIG
jgi:hypothetical protein